KNYTLRKHLVVQILILAQRNLVHQKLVQVLALEQILPVARHQKPPKQNSNLFFFWNELSAIIL
ncbi:MAG: hypothetical protein EB153_07850, partial [Nitrosopumilaceae archaeon]|nr:hypothetical protein [Nitrosopumilaceae archaeon]